MGGENGSANAPSTPQFNVFNGVQTRVVYQRLRHVFFLGDKDEHATGGSHREVFHAVAFAEDCILRATLATTPCTIATVVSFDLKADLFVMPCHEMASTACGPLWREGISVLLRVHWVTCRRLGPVQATTSAIFTRSSSPDRFADTRAPLCGRSIGFSRPHELHRSRAKTFRNAQPCGLCKHTASQ